jgi:uncharacterized membrane protein YhhN
VRSGRADGPSRESLVTGWPRNHAALELIAFDETDPDRDLFLGLMLEAASERWSGDRPRGAAEWEAQLETWRVWLSAPGTRRRGAAALLLAGAGESGHEARVVAFVESHPVFLRQALEALSVPAGRRPAVVDGLLDRLTPLVVASPDSDDGSAPTAEAFTKLGTPGVMRRRIALIRDPAVSGPKKGAFLPGLASELTAAQADQLLGDPGWQRELRHRDDAVSVLARDGYSAFLDGIVGVFPEQGPRTKDLLVEALEALPPSGSNAQNLIEALYPRLARSDAAVVERIARAGGWSSTAALFLAERVDLSAGLVPHLERGLSDRYAAFWAARVLGRRGHPAALDVLIERGVKVVDSAWGPMLMHPWLEGSLFPHGVGITELLFRAYGRQAEERLEALLDYPNADAQVAAIYLIDELRWARFRYLVQPLPLLVLLVWLRPWRVGAHRLLGAGLVAWGLSDVLTAWPPWRLAPLGALVLGQCLYAKVFFAARSNPAPVRLLLVGAAFSPVAVVAALLEPGPNRWAVPLHENRLVWAAGLVIVTLAVMTWRGLALVSRERPHGWWAAIGATSIAASAAAGVVDQGWAFALATVPWDTPPRPDWLRPALPVAYWSGHLAIVAWASATHPSRVSPAPVPSVSRTVEPVSKE